MQCWPHWLITALAHSSTDSAACLPDSRPESGPGWRHIGLPGGPTVPICLHVGETDDEVHRRAAELDRLGRDRGIEGMPLFGVPCAVKNNIDVAGLATTAGCPAYRNWPERNASCVQRLLDAGAIVVGKNQHGPVPRPG